ncbi:outer membrane protein assembly factor BamE [Aliikangiella sp. G2MR2-5]|uniref:outer membrane protein assembly factor BamE n=1 Tax=Aliikangiella sp. G2MR2-5 TaxID=2788943 RepID=UPI0018A9106E|nr:outer membrane protein assembly factor BamE [Aliikangiella sp. G2MR2-5]
MVKKLSILLLLLVSACVYRIDIQQGNILDQEDIDMLRPGLTKDQVVFVLGAPVVNDAFKDDKWIYLYSYKNAKEDILTTKKLVLHFKEEKLVSAAGDYDIPAALQIGGPQPVKE